ncbi:MAG: hypothetical protein KJN98_02265, partial [Pontiella sp.]|nr:hypothetical protein [Pontiella sp.]
MKAAMDTLINQAVVFTKPLHHLGISLTPDELAGQTVSFLSERGFRVAYSKKVTGPELAEREIIRQHYLIYSKASYGDILITDEGRARFREAFEKEWDDEVEARRIMGNPQLIEYKDIDVHKLFSLWNAQFGGGHTRKIQDGVIIARIEELDCYCINAFYPAMEENFYHPATEIDYY